jgi:hypothetical protein
MSTKAWQLVAAITATSASTVAIHITSILEIDHGMGSAMRTVIPTSQKPTLKQDRKTRMIITRYEKGQKFLDLVRWYARCLDEDGCSVDDECWEVVIWENTSVKPDEHRTIEFGSEMMARMFIEQNGWKEQVLW